AVYHGCMVPRLPTAVRWVERATTCRQSPALPPVARFQGWSISPLEGLSTPHGAAAGFLPFRLEHRFHRGPLRALPRRPRLSRPELARPLRALRPRGQAALHQWQGAQGGGAVGSDRGKIGRASWRERGET